MNHVSYLVIYELNKERILCPLAYSLNKSYRTDDDLIAIIKEFADGKFLHLIESIDPENRNAIAHVTYSPGYNEFLHYPAKSGEMIKSKVNFQNDIHVFNALDGLLDDNTQEFMKSMGIAKLIINLSGEYLPNSQYYIDEARTLRDLGAIVYGSIPWFFEQSHSFSKVGYMEPIFHIQNRIVVFNCLIN